MGGKSLQVCLICELRRLFGELLLSKCVETKLAQFFLTFLKNYMSEIVNDTKV
jgi:hypothetical protein